MEDEGYTECSDIFNPPYKVRIVNETKNIEETFICDDFFPLEQK